MTRIFRIATEVDNDFQLFYRSHFIFREAPPYAWCRKPVNPSPGYFCHWKKKLFDMSLPTEIYDPMATVSDLAASNW